MLQRPLHQDKIRWSLKGFSVFDVTRGRFLQPVLVISTRMALQEWSGAIWCCGGQSKTGHGIAMEYYNAPKAIASGQDGPSRASVFLMSPEGDSQSVLVISTRMALQEWSGAMKCCGGQSKTGHSIPMEYYNAPKAIASGQDGPSRASVFLVSPEGDSQSVLVNNSLYKTGRVHMHSFRAHQRLFLIEKKFKLRYKGGYTRLDQGHAQKWQVQHCISLVRVKLHTLF